MILRRLLPSALCLLPALAACAQASVSTLLLDERAALADRAGIPASEHSATYYLSYSSAAPGEALADLKTATRLMVASTSRQVVLERSAPAPVTPTLSRIHLGDLQWADSAWRKAIADYPYAPHVDPKLGQTPLVIRADWLLVRLADATESSAYYDLLLGETPNERDQWLGELGVDRQATPELRYGQVEEQSGVAKQRVRWLESFPVLAPGGSGYAWGTRDSLEITGETDPLEHPDGGFDHDGEEWIVSLPKISTATREAGVLQAYLLSNGDGKRVDVAPVALVEDTTRFRGLAEIRNPGSCIQCHAEGLNKPTRNGLADYVLSGANLFTTDRDEQVALEAFHLRRFDRQLDRANEDYAIAVEALTGQEPKAAAEAFKRAVNRYDAALTLEDAAREMGCAPATLRNAIAGVTGRGEPLPARVAGLPHGRSISRAAFEERYHELEEIKDAWTR